jgi:hypothetical protein
VGNAFITTTLVLGGDLTAPNIYTKAEVDSLVTTPSIADGSLSIAKTSGLQDALLVRATTSSLVAGLNIKQDSLSGNSTVTVGDLTATSANITALKTRFLGDNGSTLYLGYNNDGVVRVGRKLRKIGINCDPSVQLDVVGSGRFTGPLVASNFPPTSDARIKKSVETYSHDECAKLVQAIRPKTYKRNDMGSVPRLRYIAQDWDRELSGGFRCIMGSSEDENGPLLALDYSRIVPMLHGALFSALARIEALESRV